MPPAQYLFGTRATQDIDDVRHAQLFTGAQYAGKKLLRGDCEIGCFLFAPLAVVAHGTIVYSVGFAKVVQQRAAAAGVGVYLESTNPRNLPFYGSCGFQRLGEFELLPDGPPAFRLWWQP